MEILSEGEARDFSLFLDAFTSDAHAPGEFDGGQYREGGGAEWGGRAAGGAAMDLPGGGRPPPSLYSADDNYRPSQYSVPPPSSTPSIYQAYPSTSSIPHLPPNPHAYHQVPSNGAYSYPAPTTSSSSYPASFAPPLPAYASSYSAPPSIYAAPPPPAPYPSQPLSSIDEEKKARMAQQTRDLAEWMASRGGAAEPTRKGKGRVEGRTRDEEMDEGSPPKRSRTLDERPPLAVGEAERDTMLLMREAELRAGFSKRANSRTTEEPARSTSVPAPIPVARAPTARPAPIPIPKPASTKRKAPKTSSRLPPPPPSLPSSENPPPAQTPSNIPPSPPGPRPSFPRPPILAPPPPPPRPTPTPSGSTKPALLSTAQKKANHIASEQKRRAAIRAGYEGLCSVVPSLRAAVEEFEDRVKKVGGKAEKKRRGSGGALMGGIEIGGEKVDGRAGPKSEAVVLGKSEFLLALLFRAARSEADGFVVCSRRSSSSTLADEGGAPRPLVTGVRRRKAGRIEDRGGT